MYLKSRKSQWAAFLCTQPISSLPPASLLAQFYIVAHSPSLSRSCPGPTCQPPARYVLSAFAIHSCLGPLASLHHDMLPSSPRTVAPPPPYFGVRVDLPGLFKAPRTLEGAPRAAPPRSALAIIVFFVSRGTSPSSPLLFQ